MGRNAKQVDDLVLKVGELGIEDLDSFSTRGQRMAVGVTEEAQYLFGGWMSAQTLLGVKREFPDTFPSHGQPEFALY